MKKPKYSKNNSYFLTPNIENCYWAGFIAGDGHIGYINKYPMLTIDLKDKDINLLYAFKKDTDFTGRVYTIERKRLNTKYTSAKINICSIKENWYKDLFNNWNITSNKTFTLKPPNITNLNLCLSYIVGLIDSDGCISYGKGGHKNSKVQYIRFSISGTKELLEWIRDIFSIIEPSMYKQIKIVERKGCYVLTYGRKRAWNLLKQLKNIPTPYKLSRKWDKVNEEKYSLCN